MFPQITYDDVYPGGVAEAIFGIDDRGLGEAVSGHASIDENSKQGNGAMSWVVVVATLVIVRILWEMAD